MAGSTATRRDPIQRAQAKASVFMAEVIGRRALRLLPFDGAVNDGARHRTLSTFPGRKLRWSNGAVAGAVLPLRVLVGHLARDESVPCVQIPVHGRCTMKNRRPDHSP